jgi:hypothetical protein
MKNHEYSESLPMLTCRTGSASIAHTEQEIIVRNRESFQSMKYRFSTFMSSVLIAALVVVPVLCQTDWPTYGHDAGSTHYSPLKQIDTKNVSKLTRSWTFHMNSADSAATAAATPAAGAGGGRGGGKGVAAVYPPPRSSPVE